MKAAFLEATGAPEVIRYGDLPTPTPKGNEVLVKVASTAVVAQMLGLARDAVINALSLAWVDAADATAPLDLVIANAGIQGGLWRGGVGETRDELDRVMGVNFAGMCNTIHPALPAMRRRP